MMSSCCYSRIPSTFFFLLLAVLALAATEASRLPHDEVNALREIANALKKKTGKAGWDFDVDPCSWGSSNENNAVTCDCMISNDTVCHVTNISLKFQSLPGTLPEDFVRLPYLQNLDLSQNCLNGSIPPRWGALQNIFNISLFGNRLTGRIPKEIGKLSTLKSLVLEFNHLTGELPADLGNLTKLERLLLTSNNFSGAIPPTFAKLTALKDVWLGDNQFTGMIPDFIGKWTNLTRLVIQASGLQGPVPPSIAALGNLTDLRITDLNGSQAPFPNIRSTAIKTLILRNCNLIGELPGYVAGLKNLETLDVSFNKLSGKIPGNYSNLHLNYLYLTENQLTGLVPTWIERGDLSFNNFSDISNCQPREHLNLFTSLSAANKLGTTSCLKISQCSKKRYNLYINCGGEPVGVDSAAYMGDNSRGSDAMFFQDTENSWGYSSTGDFRDDNSNSDTYTVSSNSAHWLVNPELELYKDARLAPTSLTYYAYCLRNGRYIVRLHFAEIMFTDDESYRSLGRRIFNVFLQEELVLRDFNIADAAGGVGKATVQNLTAYVTDGTLEIRFYWAGKGTTAIPNRGVYGPLISAITVYHANYKPPKDITAGAVAGIVVLVAFVVFLIVGILWWRRCFRQKDTIEEDLKGLDLQTGSFTLRQVKAATNNFSPENKIGEGGFGSVYKGLLADGTAIAVKQLSAKSKQGNREFVNEIGMISALQHPHLVRLYGCCIEGNQLLVVYEYMENNSLARALFGLREFQLHLDWKTRHKICVGLARGLAYLHEESTLKIVHRDIKATNVLLDKNLNPKISDFGLAKLHEEDNTHISTRIAGTFGYMAPEYAMWGYLTGKADVYSFGIVALEIVSGHSNTSYQGKRESLYLLDWAHVLKERGDLMELIDPRLGTDFNKEEAMGMIHVALLCTHVSPSVRPSMSAVVSMLEGEANVPASIPENTVSYDDTKVEAMRKHFRGIEEGGEEEEEEEEEVREKSDHGKRVHTMSTDAPWAGSSAAGTDLYPMLLDTDCWKNRD